LRNPALIIRCTESGAPRILDAELEALTASNPSVEVVHLPLTHLTPAWDAIDTVSAVVEAFLAGPVPGPCLATNSSLSGTALKLRQSRPHMSPLIPVDHNLITIRATRS
jgi:hypothetical protein